MIKKLSVLLALIMVFAVISVSCADKDNNGSKDDKIYETYMLYSANNGTMSYDEWLETIRGTDGSSFLTGYSSLAI